MSAMSRRDFARLAAGVGIISLGGSAVACAAKPGPQRAEQTQTATPTPDARTRPIKLTQADLDRIIGGQANTLLDSLRSKTNQPGVNYGVAVAFAYPNHQFSPFYVYGTVADQTPPTERTIFAIGSITKTFTAALFANGAFMRPDRFDWDAGLQRYLGGYVGATGHLSPTMQQITPRMLAQHTSGLARESTGDQDGVGLFQTEPSTPPPRLLDVWQTDNGPQPGTCWEYSNLGFITLGFTTVSAYGAAAGNPATSSPAQAYSALLHDQITQPLNMPDTVTILPGGAPVAEAYPNGARAVSAGAASDIKSSAADMHTWLLAHLGAANQTSNLMKGLAATTQPSPLKVDMCGKPNPGPANMGLAWQVQAGPPQIIWKDGLTSLGGCSCWIGMTPASPTQEPLGIAILVNGYWNKTEPNVLADSHGSAMLKQISAAI
jgi:CubicO group peptidase (beta-lactamase class C family)